MPADLRGVPSPEAVLFDLDGTLVDTVPTRIAAWLEVLGQADLPTTREELGPLIGIDGKRLVREIAALRGRPIDEEGAEEIDRRSGEIYERLNHDPKPLPGVAELLAVLDERAIKWAIATSSRRAQVSTSVGALRLAGEPAIIDASNVKHAKPEPDLLLLAARELQADPATCWCIGDSTWDMVAAVAAGMIALGVTAGSAVGAQVLAGAGARAVVATLGDLAAAITRPQPPAAI